MDDERRRRYDTFSYIFCQWLWLISSTYCYYVFWCLAVNTFISTGALTETVPCGTLDLFRLINDSPPAAGHRGWRESAVQLLHRNSIYTTTPFSFSPLRMYSERVPHNWVVVASVCVAPATLLCICKTPFDEMPDPFRLLFIYVRAHDEKSKPQTIWLRDWEKNKWNFYEGKNAGNSKIPPMRIPFSGRQLWSCLCLPHAEMSRKLEPNFQTQLLFFIKKQLQYASLFTKSWLHEGRTNLLKNKYSFQNQMIFSFIQCPKLRKSREMLKFWMASRRSFCAPTKFLTVKWKFTE